MSTNTERPVRNSRIPIAPLALLVLALACVHHTSSRITDVCTGKSVTARMGLFIDSVAPTGGDGLRSLQGERFDVVINLFNQLSPASCADRTGEASVNIDDLPDELASAASRASTAHWRVDGIAVVVELNRGVTDNNLSFTLPLDGGDGHWTLSRLPGVVAQGRLSAD